MDSDQTLKILKMVQEGFLTPEQGQRLILELAEQTSSSAKTDPFAGNDLFQVISNVGKNLGDGFDKLFEKAQQTFKAAGGPETLVFKVLDADGIELRHEVSVPLRVFLALKPLMLIRSPFVPLPLQQIDFSALFLSLETGAHGKIFEYTNQERDEKLEVWLS